MNLYLSRIGSCSANDNVSTAELVCYFTLKLSEEIQILTFTNTKITIIVFQIHNDPYMAQFYLH